MNAAAFRTAIPSLNAILERNRSGEPIGLYSVCCAHPLVICAALELARDRGQVAVIESTCNQVNQDGGYTGLTPAQFADQVRAAARAVGLPAAQLVLGGDHLGPQPWRDLPAEAAMAKAVAMIAAYAKAGYGKLHLDCSMACADDPEALSDDVIAARAALLAATAEAAIGDAEERPVYVIGTEVPAPGGMGKGHAITPTDPANVAITWHAHEAAFGQTSLQAALKRVCAIVVQPGLDFGNEDVVHFDPTGATELSHAVLDLPGAVYEAHSTDYQRPGAYRALVAGHFAILKVGPAATFALREAIYALEAIAQELAGWDPRWSVGTALEAAMLRDPRHWESHYAGDPAHQAYLRHFSYSDRLRYYWTDPAVNEAFSGLMKFLRTRPLPMPLISQYLPQHYDAVAAGTLDATPSSLVSATVRRALDPYAGACGNHLAARA